MCCVVAFRCTRATRQSSQLQLQPHTSCLFICQGTSLATRSGGQCRTMLIFSHLGSVLSRLQTAEWHPSSTLLFLSPLSSSLPTASLRLYSQSLHRHVKCEKSVHATLMSTRGASLSALYSLQCTIFGCSLAVGVQFGLHSSPASAALLHTTRLNSQIDQS